MSKSENRGELVSTQRQSNRLRHEPSGSRRRGDDRCPRGSCNLFGVGVGVGGTTLVLLLPPHPSNGSNSNKDPAIMAKL